MSRLVFKALRTFLAAGLLLGSFPALALAETDADSSANTEASVIIDDPTGSADDLPDQEGVVESVGDDEPSDPDAQPSDTPLDPGPVSPRDEDIETVQQDDAPALFSERTVPAGFTELTDVVRYPSNPFNIRIYSTTLRCGRGEADAVTFKFVPETTADEFGYQIVSISRQGEDGLNYIYDTSFGSANQFSPDDEFSFNFLASGRYQISIQVMAKDASGAQPSMSFARFSASFSIEDPSFPSIEKVADGIAQQCMAATTDDEYERALWLHDWLLANCQYDHGYNYAGAEGALVRGLGTCEAYHRAYVMLLDRVGIRSGRITGNGHVWTAVEIDGAWCQVDATWDDIDYEPHAQFPEERHLYFGLTDELMGLAHSDHKGPVSGYASSTLANNYLVKSGAIKKYSAPCTASIQQKLDAGERSFTLNDVNAGWPVSLNDAKEIINRIVAFDLSSASWSTNGKSATLTVKYADGVYLVQASVEGEIDSIPFYPGLHTTTGALRYGKSNGKYAQNEWVTVGGVTYYALANGVLAKYQNYIDGKTYYFRSSGAMVRNKFVEDKFYGSDGAMYANRFFDYGASRYYATATGAHARYQNYIDGKTYYFRSSGAMVRNKFVEDKFYGSDGAMYANRFFDHKGTTYYATASGAYARYQNIINNKVYYFWSNGSLVRDRIVDKKIYAADGHMLKQSFYDIKGNRYYAMADGTYAVYAQMIGGKEYYFWSSGIMVRNRLLNDGYYQSDGVKVTYRMIDGRRQWYDANGNWIPRPIAKTGWQNPSQYYQVSALSAMLPPQAYGSAHCYVSPTTIPINATRSDCIETMIRRAYAYLGTRYDWGWSNEPGTYVDCSGLAIQCLYAAGIATPYDSWRQFYEENYTTTKEMRADPRFCHVSLANRQRGDLIFWEGHVAIYLGNDRVIEAVPGCVREYTLWRSAPVVAVLRPFV